MCTVNLRTKTYERNQCVISSQKKKKRVCYIKTERELLISSRGPPTFSDFVTNCTIE